MTQAIDKFDWVGSIETASGMAFDVLEPTLEMFVFDDIARSLSHLCRYNGHVPTFYSVAEHSVRVAWQLRWAGHDPLVELTGLLHDAAEAYVGDMVRPLKRTALLGGVHQEMEATVAGLLHEKFGGVYPYPDAVHRADRDVYNWEVQHIRTGVTAGWPPAKAYDTFVGEYSRLMSLVG